MQTAPWPQAWASWSSVITCHGQGESLCAGAINNLLFPYVALALDRMLTISPQLRGRFRTKSVLSDGHRHMSPLSPYKLSTPPLHFSRTVKPQPEHGQLKHSALVFLQVCCTHADVNFSLQAGADVNMVAARLQESKGSIPGPKYYVSYIGEL